MARLISEFFAGSNHYLFFRVGFEVGITDVGDVSIQTIEFSKKKAHSKTSQ